MATLDELHEGDMVYIPVPVHGFLGAIDNSPAEILVELHRRYGGETIVRRLSPRDVVTAAELDALRARVKGLEAIAEAASDLCQGANATAGPYMTVHLEQYDLLDTLTDKWLVGKTREEQGE